MTDFDDDLLSAELEGFLNKSAAQRAEHHRQLHATWVQGGKKQEDLEPLLHAFEPHIRNRTKELSGGSLTDQSAVRLAVTQRAVRAFESYDPSRGVALNTHVQNHTIGALRGVIKAQNVARMPEEQALRIGKVDRARAAFEEEHGRAPTLNELAPEAGMSVPALRRLNRARVADLSSGGFEVSATSALSDRDRQNLPLIAAAIPPGTTEHAVFVALYGEGGFGGAPARTGDLAKRLGKSPHDIAKAKSQILKRIEKAR